MNRFAAIPCLSLCLLSAFFGPRQAGAYLGGLEIQDGYRTPQSGPIPSLGYAGDAQFYLNNNPGNGYTGIVPFGAYPNDMGDTFNGPDLSRYNAGQYGTNDNGPGGGALDIADNTGLWQVVYGGRLDEDAAAPYYYDGQYTRDQIVAYRQTIPHSGTQSLGIIAGDTDLRYLYHFDSRDFNGTDPASTGASLVQMSFWVNPTDWDDTYTDNIFGLSILDAANQPVFQIGYTGDDRLQYRLPGDTDWTTTALAVGNLSWSQITVSIDTFANTASLAVSVYDDSLHALGAEQVVLSDQAVGLDAGALKSLQWDMHGGPLENDAVSYNHYFDDFAFDVAPVPEPAGLVLLAGAVLALMLPRRRR